MRCISLLIFSSFCLLSAQPFLQETGRINTFGPQNLTLLQPQAIDIGADGTIFIVDSGHHRILLLDAQLNLQRVVGGFGFGYEQFDRPADIRAGSAINIFVADYNNQRILRYDRQFNFISELVSNPGARPEFQFAEVRSLLIDSQNNLYILEQSANRIIKFNREGSPELVFGGYESGLASLTNPCQLELLANNRIAVSDPGRSAILLFDSFGSYLEELTHPLMQQPCGLAADEAGLWITDSQAGLLFYYDLRRRVTEPVTWQSGQPLRQPRDIALFKDDRLPFRVLILDEDALILTAAPEKHR